MVWNIAVIMPISRNVGTLFFLHAEDGIRDGRVTGVQTCALPISGAAPEGPLLDGRRRHRDHLRTQPLAATVRGGAQPDEGAPCDLPRVRRALRIGPRSLSFSSSRARTTRNGARGAASSV